MLGRAHDPRANCACLSKLSERNMKCLSKDRQLIRKQERMVQTIGELRKGRGERIEKGSREGIEKETKRQLKRRRA